MGPHISQGGFPPRSIPSGAEGGRGDPLKECLLGGHRGRLARRIWLVRSPVAKFQGPKSNVQTILSLPDSGRLRFPLNIGQQWGGVVVSGRRGSNNVKREPKLPINN